MMNFKQNEEAVSPVIGVILMVAITVILAAVIAAFVFGMTDNVQTQKNVAVGLQKDGVTLQVTIQGGADVTTLNYLKVTVDGTDYYTVAGNSKTLNAVTSGGLTEKLSVGNVYSIDKMSQTVQKRVVVTGHFSDGHEQMLTDGTL
jgi:flagellin-like protein